MRLSRLIGLELEALKKENEKTKQNIEKYIKILSDKKYMKKVIKDDLESIIKEYGQPRKTSIKNIEKAVIKKEAPKAFKEVVLMDKFVQTSPSFSLMYLVFFDFTLNSIPGSFFTPPILVTII